MNATSTLKPQEAWEQADIYLGNTKENIETLDSTRTAITASLEIVGSFYIPTIKKALLNCLNCEYELEIVQEYIQSAHEFLTQRNNLVEELWGEESVKDENLYKIVLEDGVSASNGLIENAAELYDEAQLILELVGENNSPEMYADLPDQIPEGLHIDDFLKEINIH